MSAETKIEWADKTWNPVRGCSVVSPGCSACYAMKQAHRFSGEGKAYFGLTEIGPKGPRWTGKIHLAEDQLDKPLHWRKPRRIFVNSMSDLFHEDVPDVFTERVFSVMALAERHTFQVLTKRPDRMLAWFNARRFDVKDFAILQTEKAGECLYAHPWPLPNVWLGVSVENQRFADERIPLLLQTPAAVRFLSLEPLLEQVDLTNYLWTIPGARRNGLHWLIVGGESGQGARPFDVAWARWTIAQGRSAGVPVFVKQLGAFPTVRNGDEYQDTRLWASHVGLASDRRAPDGFREPWPYRVQLRNRKGGDIGEWVQDLRVRQFPEVHA